MRDFVITSASVTPGHPDKLCDQISDAVVDAYLDAGLRSGVIAECAIATGVVFLSVRAADDAPVDLATLARGVLVEAGYEGSPPTVMLDIARARDVSGADGTRRALAGQMVTAFGYACTHTPEAMPYPIWAAHRIARALDEARRGARLAWLHPDAQAQVAVEFRDRRPVAIRAVAITSAIPATAAERAQQELRREVLDRAFAGAPLAPGDDTRLVFVPGPGPGGPGAHSGLTGRKGSDDTYGGFVRQSAAGLSGKDPSRADRIAAYAARHAARCVVAAGLAAECEVQLSYILGDRGPVTVEVDSFGSARVDDAALSGRIREVFDLGVDAIQESFGLWDLPAARGGRFYRTLATFGHIGRDEMAPPWEETGPAARLR